jgi:hypothetical protein
MVLVLSFPVIGNCASEFDIIKMDWKVESGHPALACETESSLNLAVLAAIQKDDSVIRELLKEKECLFIPDNTVLFLTEYPDGNYVHVRIKSSTNVIVVQTSAIYYGGLSLKDWLIMKTIGGKR